MHIVPHFELKKFGIVIPALPLISCATLEKSLNLLELQSSHLYNPDNNTNDTKLVVLLRGLNEKRCPVCGTGELIYLLYLNFALGQQ